MKLSRLHVAEYLHMQLKKCQLCVLFGFSQQTFFVVYHVTGTIIR